MEKIAIKRCNRDVQVKKLTKRPTTEREAHGNNVYFERIEKNITLQPNPSEQATSRSDEWRSITKHLFFSSTPHTHTHTHKYTNTKTLCEC
jgi:hypothetical protein